MGRDEEGGNFGLFAELEKLVDPGILRRRGAADPKLRVKRLDCMRRMAVEVEVIILSTRSRIPSGSARSTLRKTIGALHWRRNDRANAKQVEILAWPIPRSRWAA